MLAACSVLHPQHFNGTPVDQPAPDFTLTSDHGTPWRLSEQRGKVIALFFGYTHCEDTCPATLAKLSNAITAQGTRANDARIAFITVDPQRDTPAVLKAYVQRFEGGRIVGLTGPPAEIERIEHAYHVWAQKIPGKRGGENYDDSHSAIIFLIDASGTQRVIHDPDDKLEAIAADIHTLLP